MVVHWKAYKFPSDLAGDCESWFYLGWQSTSSVEDECPTNAVAKRRCSVIWWLTPRSSSSCYWRNTLSAQSRRPDALFLAGGKERIPSSRADVFFSLRVIKKYHHAWTGMAAFLAESPHSTPFFHLPNLHRRGWKRASRWGSELISRTNCAISLTAYDFCPHFFSFLPRAITFHCSRRVNSMPPPWTPSSATSPNCMHSTSK